MPTLIEKNTTVDENGKPLNPDIISIDYLTDKFKKIHAQKPGDIFILLEARTGSGKSTVMPGVLSRLYPEKSIIVTQPRKKTTISIPEGLPQYYKHLEIGVNLGYSTSDNKIKVSKGLMYVTIATFLNELNNLSDEQLIKKYSFIIVDEVHVRTLALDRIFMMLREFAERNYLNPDCPQVILTSATFNIEKYSKYFDSDNIFRVIGDTYTKTEIFMKFPPTSLSASCTELITQINKNKDESFKHILIFVSSTPMFQELEKGIKSHIDDIPNIRIVKAFTATMDEATKFLETEDEFRKVIIGTNAIETGITISFLKYVIDPGWEQSPIYLPNFNVFTLMNRPVSKGAATQRKGRVGREAPGICHFLYTEDDYKLLRDESFPDLVTDETSNLVFSILQDEYGTARTLDEIELYEPLNEAYKLDSLKMMDPPSGESIIRSLDLLHKLGFIDNMNRPTKMGMLAKELQRVSFGASKMILSGLVYNISLKDLLIVTQIMDIRINKREIIYDVIDGLKWGKVSFNYLLDGIIERMFFYHGFKKAIDKGIQHGKDWCRNNKFSYIIMVDKMGLAASNIGTMKKLGIKLKGDTFKNKVLEFEKGKNISTFLDYVKRFKMCIYQGYGYNLSKRVGDKYLNREGLEVGYYKFFKIYPKYITYDSATYMADGLQMQLRPDNISVLSGYVGVDENFC